MISQAGAALIATIYPIGLLIITVNRRDLEPPRQRLHGRVRRIRAIIETIRGLAIIGGVITVMGCVFAVAIDSPIRNPSYIFGVVASGLVIGVTAMTVLQDLGFSAATRLMNRAPATNPHRLSHLSSRSVSVRTAMRSGRLSARVRSRIITKS